MESTGLQEKPQHHHRLLIHRFTLVGGEECRAVCRDQLLVLDNDKVWLERWEKLVEPLDRASLVATGRGAQGTYIRSGTVFEMTSTDSQNTQMTGVGMIMEQFTPGFQSTQNSQQEDSEGSMLMSHQDAPVSQSTDADTVDDPWKVV